MVKNKTGGNKGKSMGRKHVTGNSYNSVLRKAQEEGEIYGCVTKLLGNGMCYVDCIDSNGLTKRLCIIRNKFRGRGKRDNVVSTGSLVLVGARDWETKKEGSVEKCDLIEIYNSGEKDRLMSSVPLNWNLIKTQEECEKEESDDVFTFNNNTTDSVLENEIEEITNNNDNTFGVGEEIDIDDI